VPVPPAVGLGLVGEAELGGAVVGTSSGISKPVAVATGGTTTLTSESLESPAGAGAALSDTQMIAARAAAVAGATAPPADRDP
jgi:hypothetical protein